MKCFNKAFLMCITSIVETGKGYKAIKAYFENNLPKMEEIYNNYHALIVINGKEHCRKKPVCNGCPLYGVCGRCEV